MLPIIVLITSAQIKNEADLVDNMRLVSSRGISDSRIGLYDKLYSYGFMVQTSGNPSTFANSHSLPFYPPWAVRPLAMQKQALRDASTCIT